MRLTLLSLFVPFAAFSAVYSPETLPAPSYADCEVSTNLAFNTGDADKRFLCVDMRLNATLANAVYVAFGVDENADGVLAPEETQVRLGWECGVWFVRDEVSGWYREWQKIPGVRALSCRLRYDAHRIPRALEMKDGNIPLSALRDVPRTLFNSAWNIIRVTAWGRALSEEYVSVRNANDATVIRIR